jgi:hypothetical protein
VNLEGIPYHTQEEESNLQEFLKGKFDVREDTNGMDPLLEEHVRIPQLIKDMHNMRGRDPFQYSRTIEWVSPYGESQLLDEVFHDI